MALTKAELAENLFQVLGINKREAKELVEIFFEEIRTLLEQGHQIRLSGFGNFNLRDKRERPGRNPKTGKDVPIAARRVVTFRAGQKLKARVEKYAGTTTAGADSTQATGFGS
ncbi:MAG: integration host factor subunit alpha [Gammaproteobacteria bacterium]|nr:integration host factor subunit alpha [Gammaproteobacteria bacterium]